MATALALSPYQALATLGQSVESYTQTVRQIPILSPEEERRLGERLYDQQDVEAARLLVLSHLRFVLHIAQSYRGYGLPQADIIQEGNIGLMKAVKRFNPHLGVRLISFAVHWIRAEIHEFILRNWRIVKVATTNAQRKLFFKLRGAKQRLGWFNQEEVQAVAKDLGVSSADVLEMEKRLTMQDTAFDANPEQDDDDSGHFAPAAYLEDRRYDPADLLEQQDWRAHSAARLMEALSQLDARSRDIVQRRWLDEQKATLQELADEYQVSAERIRQIEKAAFKKVRQQVEEDMAV